MKKTIIHLTNTTTGKLTCGHNGKNTGRVISLKDFRLLPRDIKCLWCSRLTNRII